MDTQSSAQPSVSIPPQQQPQIASDFHSQSEPVAQDTNPPQAAAPESEAYQQPTYQPTADPQPSIDQNQTTQNYQQTQNPGQDQQPPQSQTGANPDQYPPQSDPNQTDPEFFANTTRPPVEELIFSWEAPSRPFKKRSRQYYTTIIAIVFLISLILLFSRQFLPIAVVISVAFLAYVLSAVPPNKVTNSITTYGLRIDDQLYFWDEMGTFWFEEKYDQTMFHVETVMFPNRITFMMNDIAVEDMRAVLTEVLIEQKPADTFYDKAADWLQKNIPLENN